jgi:hypothetical protein
VKERKILSLTVEESKTFDVKTQNFNLEDLSQTKIIEAEELNSTNSEKVS